MPTRTVFASSAIMSLCGLLSACAADGDAPETAEDVDTVEVSVDPGAIAVQGTLKMDALTIKQTGTR